MPNADSGGHVPPDDVDPEIQSGGPSGPAHRSTVNRGVIAAVVLLVLVVVSGILLSRKQGDAGSGGARASYLTADQMLQAFRDSDVPCSDWSTPVEVGRYGGRNFWCTLPDYRFHTLWSSPGSTPYPPAGNVGMLNVIASGMMRTEHPTCRPVTPPGQSAWVVKGGNWTVVVQANDVGNGFDVQSTRPLADAVSHALGGGLVCPVSGY